jgi:predicted PurR-regulated permease PerM
MDETTIAQMKANMTTTITSVIQKLLLLFLIFAGLYYAQEFLMPLVIGAILATLFLPLCQWMEGRKLPKSLAVLVCILCLLLLIAALASMLGWKVTELTNDVTRLKQKGVEVLSQVQQYLFHQFGISLENQREIFKTEQPSYTSIVQTVAGSLTSILTTLVLVFIYFVFLLYYRSHVKNFALKLSSSSQRAEVEHIIHSAAEVSQQYLVGLFKMIGCLWIMYGIGFSIIGVDDALFFAILCGLLEIVPFVGNITGTTLTLLVSALHGANTATLVGIAITYGVVQFIQGWVLEPLILGPQVKINPLFTIVALVLGELLWGIPGIILAIPLTAIFKIVCDHVEPLKPYGFLIGEIESPKKHTLLINKIKRK